MPGNDERREVAARLREWADSGLYATRNALVLAGAILSATNTDATSGTVEDIMRCLADLVEPTERTCSMELCDTGEEFMPECREKYLICEHCKFAGYYVQVNESADYWCEKPSYCPECGARVLKEGE